MLKCKRGNNKFAYPNVFPIFTDMDAPKPNANTK